MNDIWVKESPISVKEGAVFALAITINGGTTISASSSALYKSGTAVTAPVSGSDSFSGNVATGKTLTFAAGTAGVYVFTNTVTIDGITWVYACELIVTRAGAEQ